jgi:cytochrome c oxidase assembly protein subunit 15
MSPLPRTLGAALARGFGILAALTYALIVLGALVRAHGAGLACPDWPLCFGEVVPRFDARIALEWGHRALAGCVTLGLAALSLAAWRRELLRGWLGWRLLALWALLLTQAGLGALTVLLLLAPWTVTVHLLLGNALCASLLWTALDLAERDAPLRERLPSSAGARAALAAVAVAMLAQMALGGMVSSHAAGLACAAFPTCDGSSLVPTLRGPVGLHVLHRLNGVALLGALAGLAWLARGTPRLARLARAGARLTLAQIALGGANVLLRLPVEVTALHSATAAALVLVSALLVREALHARALPRSARALVRPAQAA